MRKMQVFRVRNMQYKTFYKCDYCWSTGVAPFHRGKMKLVSVRNFLTVKSEKASEEKADN